MKKRAVLVGINGYPAGSGLSQLRCAERDAEMLGTTLRTHYGFEVEVLTGLSATRDRIEEAVLEGVPAETFLFFFAGHGQLIGNSYCLHPIDSTASGRKTLPFAQLASVWQERQGYRNVLSILDACRSQGVTVDIGGARKAAQPFDEKIGRNISQVAELTARDRWFEVLYGCVEGQFSYEDPNRLGHGFLTKGLLHALEPQDGRLDSHVLLGRACDWMREWCHQDPENRWQEARTYGPKSERPPFVLREGATVNPEWLQVPNQYSTIQKAIDAAQPGQTVYVHQGCYTETLGFKAGITLRGESAEKVTISWDTTSAPILVANACNEGLITGISFRNLSIARGTGSHPALKLTNVNLVVANCYITGARGYGIYVIGGAPGIQDTHITGNSDGGIAISGGSRAMVRGCRCSGNHDAGIVVRDAGTVVAIHSNECNRNSRYGIYFDHGAAGEAHGNTCKENTVGIVAFDAGTTPTLQENTCRGNREEGICVYRGARPEIRANSCNENGGSGIAIGTDAELTGDGVSAASYASIAVARNSCCHNKKYGILLAEGRCAGATLVENTCCHNTLSGIGVARVQPLLRSYNVIPPIIDELRNNTSSDNHVHGIQISSAVSFFLTPVSGNLAERNKGAGIKVSRANADLEKNRCRENGSCGIEIRDSEATLVENICGNNGLHGIRLGGGATGRASRNTCERNAGDGIAVYNSGFFLDDEGMAYTKENGKITLLWDDGEYTSGTGFTPIVEENQLNHNNGYGIYIDENSCPCVRDNVFRKNKKGEINESAEFGY